MLGRDSPANLLKVSLTLRAARGLVRSRPESANSTLEAR